VAHRYALELDSGVLERIQDDRPSQEHVLLWRDEWQRLQRTIDDMPERCRDVFIQRRVLGSSQRETAEFLNISENVVEKEAARGLRMIAHATPDEYAPAL
jgi:RNA polymerase sigma-70 factor (ECF subfamily)